ncbi:MAG: hypothetical protein A2X08_03900 [Bacteroidetes bacterium GWA2_32_17]|nr:MAG: hypothetical protein A2X08_03900 [Bacteroidetes bacterium GWA2_32_17]
MKYFVISKLLFICTMLFLSILDANCQIDNTYVKSNPNSPEISFTKTIHNFGSLQKKSDASIDFVFKNTGKSPLVLKSVTPSCDCTTPDWPKGPIMPGKTGTIKVVYETKEMGVFNKTITVVSNAITNKIELSIQGEVYEK